jgi:hypothetical protein
VPLKQMTLKPQDLLVALKISLETKGENTFARLASELFISASEVHAAVNRAEVSRLVSRREGRLNANRRALKDFLLHGAIYAFPPITGALTRGTPTGAAAPPLRNLFQQAGVIPHVWPDPEGSERGIALCPLYPSVPRAAHSDPRLREILALMDAYRVGAAREREAAETMILERYQ